MQNLALDAPRPVSSLMNAGSPDSTPRQVLSPVVYKTSLLRFSSQARHTAFPKKDKSEWSAR